MFSVFLFGRVVEQATAHMTSTASGSIPVYSLVRRVRYERTFSNIYPKSVQYFSSKIAPQSLLTFGSLFFFVVLHVVPALLPTLRASGVYIKDYRLK